MHVRWSTHHRKTGVVRYAQLVESFRRPDGVPAHRVIANLGQLSQIEFDNLRTALQAAREGQSVVLDGRAQPQVSIQSNLRYLGAAVLLRVWRELGLDDLLRHLDDGDSEVPPERVVVALVIHRCLAPGSKLSAVEWYPTTALPELLGVPPSKFNNSRVHRVLDALDAGTQRLQAQLPTRLRARQGAFAALFLDATDTWFEGRGPDLALPGRDKEGIYRRRIGIILVCDQRGYPLAWKVVPGDFRDPVELMAMAQELAGWEWARGLPIVMDRAAGRSRSVGVLKSAGVRFVTALPADEFSSCGAPVSLDPFKDLELSLTDVGIADDVAKVKAAALKAGFQRVTDKRFVLDLGVFDKDTPADQHAPSQAVFALRLALRLAADSEIRNDSALAVEYNFSTRQLRRYRALLALHDDIQESVARGRADTLTLDELVGIAAMAPDEQLVAFDELLQARAGAPRRLARAGRASTAGVLVRGVLHLNPDRLVAERRAAASQREEVETLTRELNATLAEPTCRRQDATVVRDVQQLVERYSLGDVFTVAIAHAGTHRQLVIGCNEDVWRRRRGVDGLNVMVAHPEMPYSAAEIVELYFAKDRVEKDFQMIKSVVELRPVHHRTDGKVRAHVALCMLATLLECVLDDRLRTAGMHRSAAAMLETLGTCHLNLLDEDGQSLYLLTEPTHDQRLCLNTLQMNDLVDPLQIMETITPR
jgi:hypothetical protein